MDLKNLVPVVWSNQRVLTTAQLAEFYGTSPDNLKKNFNANKDRFIDGKHYFKLEGKALATFKDLVTESHAVQPGTSDRVTVGYAQNLRVTVGYAQNLREGNSDLQISSMTRVLYLWTERGAARHAKMLSTDKAWEVFEDLEDTYFNQNPVALPAPAAKPAVKEPDLARVYLLQLSDGTIKIVKIGQSKNIRSRVAKIKRETGLKITNMYFTPYMPREIARLVEWTSQEVLSSWCAKGEFFSVDFNEARKVIDYCVEIAFAQLPGTFKQGENFLQVVDK